MDTKKKQEAAGNGRGENADGGACEPNHGHRIFKLILLAALVYGIFWFADYSRLYGPDRTPDHVLLNITENPGKSVALTWRASLLAGEGEVEIGPVSEGPADVQERQKITAGREMLWTLTGPAWYYSTRVDGLNADTEYMYRVGSGDKLSEWAVFETAPVLEGSAAVSANAEEAFTFVYLGDVQNHIFSDCSRVLRRAYSDVPEAAFFLYAGDIVNRSRDEDWGQWFGASGFIHRTVPVVPTPGNHEYDDGKLCRHWRRIFELPGNGPDEAKERAYYFDYLNARFVCLDSNFDHGVQAAWLERVLGESPRRWWTIVYFHHPIYSAAKKRDNRVMRDAWQPLFDEYGVDLVLQGHDHAYGRTGFVSYRDGALADMTPVEGDTGPVYVVSVAGPKVYEMTPSALMRVTGTGLQLYQVITIDGDTLSYKAKTAAGRLFDAFDIIKPDTGAKQLIEYAPE